MKTLYCIITACCMLFSTALYAQNDWVLKLAAQSGPPSRYFHAMASLGGDKSLMFGGSDYYTLDDTWIYDLSDNAWLQQNPLTKPSPRFFHGMADVGDNKVLLFGGYNYEWPSDWEMDDTWMYDIGAGTWTQKLPTTKPTVRSGHAMAYIGDDKVLLFGGGFYSPDNETWIYDLSDNTWTQKFHQTKPTEAWGNTAVYIGGDRVLLFGGIEATAGMPANNETWVYDLSENAWIQLYPGTPPPARGHHSMAFLGGDQIVLYGRYEINVHPMA